MKQDTGKFRKNTKEQFYTTPEVARDCVKTICEVVRNGEDYLWLEPAAGDGVFLRAVPSSFNCFGIDIEPKSNLVVADNYLSWEPSDFVQDIIVFGNPPFGRQSKLAKQFIHRSCKFAKYIAFILPRSFTKPSMFNAFNAKFHMVHCNDLPKDSFTINGDAYDVPCVFQVWEKRDIDRPYTEKATPVGFDYVKQEENFHLAFRRVGALAGKCYPNDDKCFSDQSHYFIQLHNGLPDVVEHVISSINKHEFPSNTVGPRSISKPEACEVINKILLEKM